MKNSIKVKCSDTTYVDNINPNINFFNEEFVFVGIANTEFHNINSYKSIFKFSIPNLYTYSLESIYLFLYVSDMDFTNSSVTNINIGYNSENTNINNIYWSNFPNSVNTEHINLKLPYEAMGKYIKINITNIIKSINKYDENFNIIMEPIDTDSNHNSIVRFSSKNSPHPPYLVIIDNNNLNDEITDQNNSLNSTNISINDYKDEFIKKDNYEELLWNVKKYSNKINDYDNKFKEIKSYLDNINKSSKSYDSNIAELNKSLDNYANKLNDMNKNFVNYDNKLAAINKTLTNYNDKLNSISKNVSNYEDNLNTSNKSNDFENEIKNLNESINILKKGLSKIKHQVDKLSKTVSSITIEPLDMP